MGNTLRISQVQFDSLQAKKQRKSSFTKSSKIGDLSPDSASREIAARDKFYALGRLPKSEMNKTEAAYADLLEARKVAGEILSWKFHPMNVRLANNTFYEVDFLVVTKDLELQIHETKGTYTTQVGNMKIKLCAEVLPFFRFIKCIKQAGKDGGWKFKEY